MHNHPAGRGGPASLNLNEQAISHPAPRVTVVIPTWRGREWLPRCLDALRAQTFPDFEIVVVDNGSRDGSHDYLRAQPDLRLLVNATNQGFAAACNQGIRASAAEFVAILNDDAQPSSAWLAALVEAMDADAGIGACASLMVFTDRPSIVQSAGIAIDRAAIAWDRLGGRPVPEAAAPADIFGASAGAALYRRAMLDEIGLFDERFFAYLEDVDMAWRAQAAGWSCRYVPGALVHHATSATAEEGSPFKKRLLGRNKVWLVAKNAPLPDLPIVIGYDLAAIFFAGLRRGDWYHLMGRLEGLRGLLRVLVTRRAARVAMRSPLVAPWNVPQRVAHVEAAPHPPFHSGRFNR